MAATSANGSGFRRPYLTLMTSPVGSTHRNFGVWPPDAFSRNLQTTSASVGNESGPGGFARKSTAGTGVAGSCHTRARARASLRSSAARSLGSGSSSSSLRGL